MHNEYIESLLTIMATAGAVTLPAFLIVGALIEICQTLYRQKKRRQNKRR